MGPGDKISNSAEKGLGSVKEQAGKLLDNQKLEHEGRVDQVTADAKQAGEKVKDAAMESKNGLNK